MSKKPADKEVAALLKEMEEFEQELDDAVEADESLEKLFDTKQPKFPASGKDLEDIYPDLTDGLK